MTGQLPTAARVRELFAYDASTGVFTRRVRTSNRINVGDVAGVQDRKGYLLLRVDGVIYKAHRVAWLYVHGDWPQGLIDHINGNTSDNRIANLRDVSRAANMQNLKRAMRTSSTGMLGVHRNPGAVKPFKARIVANGVPRHLGVFDTAEEAHEAYLSAKRELHQGNTL
jgi:hypothetical protein